MSCDLRSEKCRSFFFLKMRFESVEKGLNAFMKCRFDLRERRPLVMAEFDSNAFLGHFLYR